MSRLSSSLAAFAICFGIASSAHAQFSNLVNRIPDGANTIVLVDVERLYRTPLGVKAGWREKVDKAFESGVSSVPSDATKTVLAAKLDYETLRPEWQVAIMDLNYEPSVPKAALRYNGTVDRIGDREVAVLPGDVYAVKFGTRVVGVGTPANRQDVGRWINRVYGNSLRGLTPYLKEAQKFAEANAPITMAMDLSHVASADRIKKKLADWPPLKATDIDLGKLSEALASVKGITLGITVKDSITGAVKVDFEKDITIVGELAKPLLLEALSNNGALISEMDAWKATVSGNSIQLTGPLYASGMRRILSVLDAPQSLQHATQTQQATGSGAQGQDDQQRLTVLASQTYFKAVSALIDDLKNDRKNRKTMGQISVWFGKYAQKIDRLPMLNVDPQLLDYGKFVSESLRTGQLQVTGAAASSRVRQNDVGEQYDVRTWGQPVGVVGGRGWNGRGGGVYGWGGWEARPNIEARGQQQARIRTQENIRGNMSASLILQGIDNATADMRRYLTQTYNAEF